MKTSPTKGSTQSQEAALLSDDELTAEMERDVIRHRVMKGHPPEGPIFQMRSAEEIAQRIKNLNERAVESTKRLAEFYRSKA
jgi:redox-sensitive bicupin YhaK (pirin superfamily)